MARFEHGKSCADALAVCAGHVTKVGQLVADAVDLGKWLIHVCFLTVTNFSASATTCSIRALCSCRGLPCHP